MNFTVLLFPSINNAVQLNETIQEFFDALIASNDILCKLIYK